MAPYQEYQHSNTVLLAGIGILNLLRTVLSPFVEIFKRIDMTAGALRRSSSLKTENLDSASSRKDPDVSARVSNDKVPSFIFRIIAVFR